MEEPEETLSAYEQRTAAAKKKYYGERLWKYKEQTFSEFSDAKYYLSLISSNYVRYIYGEELSNNMKPVMTRSSQGTSWTVFCENNNYIPSSVYLDQVMEDDMETTFRESEQQQEDFRRMQNGDDIVLPEPPHDLYDAEDEGWPYPDDDTDRYW